MGFSWVLSVRSVIVTYFSIGSNWLLKINWKIETFKTFWLYIYWWRDGIFMRIGTYMIYFFLDCNGTDVLVRAIWVSIWLLIANKYHFFFFFLMTLDALIQDFLFFNCFFFIHLILDFFFRFEHEISCGLFLLFFRFEFVSFCFFWEWF